MATGTVADERTERKRELETTRKELDAAMAKYAAAEVAAAARDGLQAAYRADRSDGSALACAKCGGPMRHAGRGESPVETVLGRVRVSMARHAC